MDRHTYQRCSACLVLILAPPLLLVLSGGSAWAQVPGDVTAAPPPPVAGTAPAPCATSDCISASGGQAPLAPESAPFVPWNPRLDLSYTSFSISNGGTATVPVNGLELDLHVLSTSVLRGGMTLSAGHGNTALGGADVAVRYGLIGLDAAVQLPARLSPFVQGNIAVGVLDGTANGGLSVPGTSVSLTGGSGATWLYTRGLDAGIHLYAVASLHLTASVGWVRATWRGADPTVSTTALSAGLKLKDITNDSFITKIGIGF